MMGKIKIRAAIMTAVALGGFGLAAPAAFACTGANCSSSGNTSVSATASIGETITLSGLSPNINFGQLAAGTPSIATGAENETVSTNDPGGYSLTVTPGANGLYNGATANIPNSAVTITETQGVATPGVAQAFSGANPLTVDTEGGAITDTYKETWTLNAPATLPAMPGNYTESFSYLALAS